MKKYYKLPPIDLKYLKKKDCFFLFETSMFDRDNYLSYIFINPVDEIKINDFNDVKDAFSKIEEYSNKQYLAGYFSYELGYYFENDQFNAKTRYDFPLIHLYVFDRAIIFNHKTGKFNNRVPGIFAGKKDEIKYKIKDLRFNIKKPDYIKKINKIRNYIRKGDTYQVNFTGKYYFDFSGSEVLFYKDLKQRQNVWYSAFCKFGDEYVISLSPELFFKKEGGKIYAKPMKGTIKRGKNIKEDAEKILQLKTSIKNRAENIMIVDLIRNDLGRISKTGSVKVSKVFDIEKYNTLFQMTSTVKSVLKDNMTFYDIFKNIFPGGSVTGAPKIRTMQIIKELETDKRKVYCGALGIIKPKGDAVFNLPIRTVKISGKNSEMGVGGGIVYDSEPAEEYEECMLKARFLTQRYKAFEILETILWDKKYVFLKEHLKRMENSAKYFGSVFNRKEIIESLKKTERKFKLNNKYRVRLFLEKDGSVRTEGYLLKELNENRRRIAVSSKKTNPDVIFYYHKTTNRKLYDEEYKRYSAKGYYDVVFLNNRNEITEGAISNIIIRKRGKYYTPPVSSGLLPGIFRDYFMKKHKVTEKPLYLRDLRNAEKIYLCNSVRGLVEVKFGPDTGKNL